MTPGTYNVRWCGGSREGIKSVRAAMKLARAKSARRFATATCGPGSSVSRATSAKTAQVVAECSERACTPFKSLREREPRYDWTAAHETVAFKRRRGLAGARRRRMR